MSMQPINASSSPEVQMNENFRTIEWASVFGRRPPGESAPLDFAYYGGRWGGFSVADDKFTLADNDVSYIVVNRSSGVPSASTSDTNWNDTAGYARIYQVTTAGGIITDVQDHRAGPGGAFFPSGASLDLNSVGWAQVYGIDASNSSGLTLAYRGGRWRNHTVAADDLSLTDNDTNYIVVAKATGVISVSTSDTNWNNTTDYARVYVVETASGEVVDVEDYRAASSGIFDPAGDGGGGGGGGSTMEIIVYARDMLPDSNGSFGPGATLSSPPTQLGYFEALTYAFDFASNHSVIFSLQMPSNWDAGAITFTPRFVVVGSAGSADLVFTMGASALNPGGDAVNVAFPTDLESSTTTGVDTPDNGLMLEGPESDPITVEGTPAAGGMVFFGLYREVDSQLASAYLVSVKIKIGLA